MKRPSVLICVVTSLATAMSGFVQLSASASGPASSAGGTSCRGTPATIMGDETSQTLHGTPRDDVIVAGGGHDIVFASGGNDKVCGGRGGDTLYGEAGNDKLFGQLGGPRIENGRATQWLGNIVDGGAGNDVLSGGPQREMGAGLPKGERPDQAVFGTATGGITISNGKVTGNGIGRDTMRRDFELVVGSSFNDNLTAHSGESLAGAGGNDRLVARNNDGVSQIMGGGGVDTIDLRAAQRGRAFGGAGNDRILGSRAADFIVSGSGADRVESMSGNDRVFGLRKGDLTLLGSGNDVIEVSSASNGGQIRAGLGNDTLKVLATGARSRIGIRTQRGFVQTGAGKFAIRDLDQYVVSPMRAGGKAGALRFLGGPSNQVLRTVRGGHYSLLAIRPGAGADTIRLSTAARRSTGAVVAAGPGNDRVFGTQRADILIGNRGGDRVDGRQGRDRCRAERELHCER
jgi:Ca2+-binding RTX toxin-like protein